MPVIICIGGNFSFQNQNSVGATVQKCAFVYTRVVCVYVSVCPQERAIKGAVWWSDCIKGVREETEWQAAEGAACGGGRGVQCRCLILPQPRA